MTLSRLPNQPTTQLMAHDVRDIVATILHGLQNSLDAASIRFEIDVPDGLDVPRSEQIFTQAVDQLIRYAMRRCDHDGELLVSARIRGDQIDFEVADSGASISSRVNADETENSPSTCMPIEFERARRLIASIGGNCQATNCPQGGVAWTINIPHPVADDRRNIFGT